MRKPKAAGTVYTAEARIQVIDTTTDHWRTLATCSDTPAAIRRTVAGLKSASGASLWVAHVIEGSLTGREYLGIRESYLKKS